jgi:hypothetical protein
MLAARLACPLFSFFRGLPDACLIKGGGRRANKKKKELMEW